MTHPSPRPVVDAFMDAMAKFGAVGSGIDQSPVTVTATWLSGFGQYGERLVACDTDTTPSAHNVLALEQARAAANAAAHALRAWISAHAPILDRNGARFHFNAGMLVLDGKLTQIIEIELGAAKLAHRGAQEPVADCLCKALSGFTHLTDGQRAFRPVLHFEVASTVWAGDPASAIAYACMIRPHNTQAHLDGQWCEILPTDAQNALVTKLLENPHV